VIKAIDLTIPEQQELGYMALRDDFERVSSLCDLSAVEKVPFNIVIVHLAVQQFSDKVGWDRYRYRVSADTAGIGFVSVSVIISPIPAPIPTDHERREQVMAV